MDDNGYRLAVIEIGVGWKMTSYAIIVKNSFRFCFGCYIIFISLCPGYYI